MVPSTPYPEPIFLELNREDAKRITAALSIRESEIRAIVAATEPKIKGLKIIEAEARHLERIRQEIDRLLLL